MQTVAYFYYLLLALCGRSSGGGGRLALDGVREAEDVRQLVRQCREEVGARVGRQQEVQRLQLGAAPAGRLQYEAFHAFEHQLGAAHAPRQRHLLRSRTRHGRPVSTDTSVVSYRGTHLGVFVAQQQRQRDAGHVVAARRLQNVAQPQDGRVPGGDVAWTEVIISSARLTSAAARLGVGRTGTQRGVVHDEVEDDMHVGEVAVFRHEHVAGLQVPLGARPGRRGAAAVAFVRVLRLLFESLRVAFLNLGNQVNYVQLNETRFRPQTSVVYGLKCPHRRYYATSAHPRRRTL